MEQNPFRQTSEAPRPRQSPAGSPHRRHGLRLPFLEGWLDELEGGVGVGGELGGVRFLKMKDS